MLLPEQSADILRNKRVVIVDDEAVIQMQLRRILTRAGMIVVGSASNADDAIDIVLDELPDIVLMDINMPGVINGLDATEALLKAVPLCIVLLTAYAHDDYQRRADAIGVCGYILKPVWESSLIPLLRDAYGHWGC